RSKLMQRARRHLAGRERHERGDELLRARSRHRKFIQRRGHARTISWRNPILRRVPSAARLRADMQLKPASLSVYFAHTTIVSRERVVRLRAAEMIAPRARAGVSVRARINKESPPARS